MESGDASRPLWRRRRLVTWPAAQAVITVTLIGAAVTWVQGPANAGPLAAETAAVGISPGPGTLQVDQGDVAASGTVAALTFTYTADPHGFLKGGTFTLTIPDGWTAPSATPGSGGYVETTAQCGIGQCVPAVNGMTVMLSDVTLGPGQSFIIKYTAATAPDSVATFDFTAQETPAADYLPVDVPPVAITTCANGVGAMSVSPQTASVSTPTDYLFTYSAGECGLLPGSAVTVEVPGGWTPPSTVPGNHGYASVSAGTVTLAGNLITITGAVVPPGQTLTLSYAGAATTTPGDAVFYTQEQSGGGSILTPLASSPRVAVQQASSSGPATSPASSRGTPGTGGRGTITVLPASVIAGRSGTLIFTYTPPRGGLSPSGALELTVPPGWTAPNGNPGSPGYVSASAGTLGVAGRRITISDVASAAGRTLTITYHDATAPRSPGPAEFRAQERASATATFSLVTPSPVLTVASSGPSVPPWLIPMLAAALVAACAALAVMTIRIRRTRARRQLGRETEVAADPHPDPPRVTAVTTTGNAPTLALRIEPHPGPSSGRSRGESW
jgi:hypothetical protein